MTLDIALRPVNRVRSSPEVILRAVACNGTLVGSVSSFVVDGDTEVTYWIDRAYWGRGIATRALELLLSLSPVPSAPGPATEPPLHQPGHAVDITARIERRQVLGGLISEYRRAA